MHVPPLSPTDFKEDIQDSQEEGFFFFLNVSSITDKLIKNKALDL